MIILSFQNSIDSSWSTYTVNKETRQVVDRQVQIYVFRQIKRSFDQEPVEALP